MKKRLFFIKFKISSSQNPVQATFQGRIQFRKFVCGKYLFAWQSRFINLVFQIYLSTHFRSDYIPEENFWMKQLSKSFSDDAEDVSLVH